MAELLLDPSIRAWVFLPIVVITFLVGLIRGYVLILFTSQRKIELHQVQDSHVMIRSRLLRENGQYIPKSSFIMRRHFFNNEETGYFKTQKRAAVLPNHMTDPNIMNEMLKGNISNALPTLLIGSWFNWMLSGFVTTKVPFPITLRFKSMLQHGIKIVTLDAAWVSSASWYFLNVVGLRPICTLLSGENNAADAARLSQDQVSSAAMYMPQDLKFAFKSEWEALEIYEHNWALQGVDAEVTGHHNKLEAIENCKQ